MRIGMILPSGFPPDIRVEKELGTLSAEHHVGLLCQRRNGQAQKDAWNGVEIQRALSRTERWRASWSLMATCTSKIWLRAIDEFVRDYRPDALHVHDLPLLGTAQLVGRKYRIPIVADLHENYPAMLEDSKRTSITQLTSLGSLVSRVSVSIPRWKRYEREVVPEVDQVIVVIEEARDRLVGFGVRGERIHVVGNYASLDASDEGGSQSRSLSEDKAFRIIYAGGFDATRDLYTVVSALGRLPKSKYPNLQLQLVGGSGRELEKLRRHARINGVEDRVNFSGWLSVEEVERLMGVADIGLVPHVKSAHTDSTIPHKLFQYMWQRLPVIVSNCAPLERIVTEAGCGLVYESGDATGLAKCISKIYREREQAEKMGMAGRRAVESDFNWDIAAASLLTVYQELSSAA